MTAVEYLGVACDDDRVFTCSRLDGKVTERARACGNYNGCLTHHVSRCKETISTYSAPTENVHVIYLFCFAVPACR